MTVTAPPATGPSREERAYIGSQTRKTNAQATNTESKAKIKDEKAKRIETKNETDRLKLERERAKLAQEQARERERQAERLEKKFVAAKQEFLKAETRDEQRIALRKLSSFTSGQDYVLEVLYQNDNLDPKMKLQSLSDLLEQSHPYGANYKRAMSLVPISTDDYTKQIDTAKALTKETPSASRLETYQERLNQMVEESQQAKKPIKAEELASDPALRYQDKSALAAQTIKALSESDAKWFNVDHRVRTFFTNYRGIFNQTVQTLLKHV